MGVLLATPSSVTLPSTWQPWTTTIHTWTAENGDSWELTSPDTGVWLGPNPQGLGMATPTHYWTEGPGVDGALWNGMITEKRPVSWVVGVYSNAGSQAWIDYDRKFWASLHPRKRGTWTVTQPGTAEVAGDTRSMRLRLLDDGNWAPDIDPALVGWGVYTVNLIAEQPFWQGKTITDSWTQAAAPVNFFGGGSVGGSGFGPPFYIGAGSSVATSTISNPGDEDAYPVWTIYGPCTAASVGLNGLSISAPITLLTGEWLQINTAPTSQVGWFGSGTVDVSTATDRTADLVVGGFGAVPPGENVPLSVSITGAGRVQIELTPLYRRAW